MDSFIITEVAQSVQRLYPHMCEYVDTTLYDFNCLNAYH